MHNVQNSMFAAAISYGLGKSLEDVRHGLRTFDSTFFQTPGRMNVFDDHPFKVILDYAHNPDAVKMMCDVVRQLEPQGMKICVISAPGDRRDEDIKSIAEIAAEHFDYFICRADDNRRKRGNDEVPKMMKDVLISSGVKEKAIDVIPDEDEAIEKALHFAKENDLLLIFGDNITRCWKQIIHFKPEGGEKSTVENSDQETFSKEVLEYFSQKDGENVIRDERGVRLAKEESD
jgi:cyanophycin synthetase